MTAAQFLNSHTSLLEGRAGLVKLAIDQPNAEKVLVNVAPVYPIDGRVVTTTAITCVDALTTIDSSGKTLWVEIVNATSSYLWSIAVSNQGSLAMQIPPFGANATDNYPSPSYVQITDQNGNCLNAYRFEYVIVN